MAESTAPWWLNEPIRLVQTNLREIDADLNPKKLVQDVLDIHANTLLFNVGGIQANYPTGLRYHFQNPHLEGDLVGDALAACREAGVRFLARFDFSKANEIYYEEHPEWFYTNIRGEIVNYNGQVHTCVNGYYQKEYSLEILREALERYPVDGVFFNMFGYHTVDYSGNYHGICQCPNCRRAFYAFAGERLPTREDRSNPVFRVYEAFKRQTVEAMLDRISDLVKGFGQHIAICTYDTYRVDIVRSEANSAVDRPLPHFLYDASENTRLVTSSYPEKTPSNAAVHFVDLPYRHVGVAPQLTELRLVQTIAAGGGPDYYVISTLDRQQDRSAQTRVRRWFAYHKKHEMAYSGLRPAAKAALVAFNRRTPEYRGLFRMLSEEHVLFHNLDPRVLERGPAALESYDVVLLAGPLYLEKAAAGAIDAYVRGGGRLLVTQEALSADPGADGHSVPIRSLGLERVLHRRKETRGGYFEIRGAERLEGFDDLDLLFIDGMYRYVELTPDARGLLRFVPPGMYGPPEKCYYDVVTKQPGVVVHPFGRGFAAYIPWNVGALYHRHSWPGHRRLVRTILDSVLGVPRRLRTDAPKRLETTLLTPGGRWMDTTSPWLLQLVNLTGHSGTAYYDPVPLTGVEVALEAHFNPAEVTSLTGAAPGWRMEQGTLTITVPEVRLLESVLIRWSETA